MDIRDVAPGNRIYLPILHPGALFSLGDVHASQGDTEFTGTAAETKATIRLQLDVIKGKRIPWMRIEKPESIVSVYAYRPLEVAVETAAVNLMMNHCFNQKVKTSSVPCCGQRSRKRSYETQRRGHANI